jgi:hypothetical protein
MRYETGAAFRRALEERLRQQSLTSGVSLVRLRKMVAFERFLARLVTAQPEAWVLKGGLALQFRLGERARTTQDVDLLLRQALPVAEIHRRLVNAALLDIGDWFLFEVAWPSDPTVLRFPVQSMVDGRLFEAFHVDVGMGDPLTGPVTMLTAPPLLEFAGIPSTIIPAYPVSQQIAEKVHAFTRLYAAGESSRIKDWVDILLLAHSETIEATALRRALQATFAARNTHPLPPYLPAPPASWRRVFLRLAGQTGLEYTTLEEAIQAMQSFLDPLLSGQASGVWNPAEWRWE